MYIKLINSMLEDMKKAPPFFQPTNYWKHLIPLITKDFETFGFENFRATQSAMNIWVGIGNIVYGTYDHQIFTTFDNDEKPPHLRLFSEDLSGKPVGAFRFNGQNYTSTSLSYLKGLVFLKKYIDTSPIRNVLEIGGGYGVLGSILLKAEPEKYFYVDVDLPPIAGIATNYLQHIFGSEAVLDYSKSRDMAVIDIEELRKKYRAAVLCPWQLPRVKGNFELAVNYISFQEMEPDVVQNYISYINSLTSHYVLLRNSRYGKETADQLKSGGVLKSTVRQDYIDYLSQFKLMAIDSKTFGSFLPNGFESEVMVFKKLNS